MSVAGRRETGLEPVRRERYPNRRSRPRRRSGHAGALRSLELETVDNDHVGTHVTRLLLDEVQDSVAVLRIRNPADHLEASRGPRPPRHLGGRSHGQTEEARVAQERVGDLRLQVYRLGLTLTLEIVELYADANDDQQTNEENQHGGRGSHLHGSTLRRSEGSNGGATGAAIAK